MLLVVMIHINNDKYGNDDFYNIKRVLDPYDDFYKLFWFEDL